jgi:hypothetical protein
MKKAIPVKQKVFGKSPEAAMSEIMSKVGWLVRLRPLIAGFREGFSPQRDAKDDGERSRRHTYQ